MTTHDLNVALPPPEAYARQSTIVDQQALSTSTVVIEGSGMLAELIALGLGGLGIGRVVLPSREDDGIAALLIDDTDRGSTPIETVLSRLAPGTRSITRTALTTPTCIISCERGEAGAQREGCGVCARAEDPVESIAVAGAALAYVAAICQGKPSITQQFTPLRAESGQETRNLLDDAQIALVGAGAIGTFCALGLALCGARTIDIIDDDRIEYTNLNRQVLFYDRINEPKAAVLLERIARIAKIGGSAIIERISPSTLSLLAGHDLICSCVDLTAPRKLFDAYAREHRVVLVDGGTSAYGGQALAYVPGKNSCVGCRRDIDSPDVTLRNSCQYSPSPSIIFPNMIIGAAMVGLAREALSGGSRETMIVYDTQENTVCESISGRRRVACDCGGRM